ncbi:MAG: PAS domain S-box protein, partial [Elusimicrobia bacterium]|nr:PAS domain S-box protein [Elusimicrobiota bacterium]
YGDAIAVVPNLVEAGDAFLMAEIGRNQAEVRRFRGLIIIVGAASLLLSLLGLLVAHYCFLRPLSALQDAIKRFEGGDFTARVELTSHGEMMSLIAAFNSMAQSVERNSSQLRGILDNSPTVIFVKDLEGRYLFVNRRCEALFHQAHGAMEGKTDFDVLPRETAEKFRAADKEVQRRGEPMTLEEAIPQDDGLHHYLTVKFPLRDSSGAAYGVCGIAADVTEKKRAESDIRLLSTGIEQSTESVAITDAEGVILYVNPSYERVTGYPRAEALGRKPSILKSGRHDGSFYAQMWGTLARGEVWVGDVVNRRKNGTEYVEHGSISPIRDAAGATTNYIAVKRDISNERALEEQLRQSQKMDAVGRLAGGVAHDFNNILTAILGYCSLLRDQVTSAAARADLDEIKASGERAAALTQQLLAFSRKQALSPKVLDLNAIVADTERMLKRVLGENVALSCLLSPELGRVKADKSQLEQVILNLAVNGRDAMPGGGNLTIETADRELDEEYCQAHAEARPGRHAMLSVKDTGTGMDARTLARIFEPFFTTKDPGRGTGLGLSMVYGIVRQSGGHIAVLSEPGRGACFQVYLPIVTEAPETEIESPAPAQTGAGEVVLLVEDEVPLRRLVARLLSSAGYAVLEAGDAESALALFQERGSEVRLLMTDVLLAKNNGRWLAEKLREFKPALRVLYTSGYTDEVIANHGVRAQGVSFLPKPFAAKNLFSAVHAALDA